jgi:hypothetical protein
MIGDEMESTARSGKAGIEHLRPVAEDLLTLCQL